MQITVDRRRHCRRRIVIIIKIIIHPVWRTVRQEDRCSPSLGLELMMFSGTPQTRTWVYFFPFIYLFIISFVPYIYYIVLYEHVYLYRYTYIFMCKIPFAPCTKRTYILYNNIIHCQGHASYYQKGVKELREFPRATRTWVPSTILHSFYF